MPTHQQYDSHHAAILEPRLRPAMLPCPVPPGPATPQRHCVLVHRAPRDPAPYEVILLWPHTLGSVYCWGGYNAFTVLLKTEARTQGPLYIKSVNNNGSSALFTLDEATHDPSRREWHPVCFLEYTRHCPSSPLSVRCFQESEFSLLYGSPFLLDQVNFKSPKVKSLLVI